MDGWVEVVGAWGIIAFGGGCLSMGKGRAQLLLGHARVRVNSEDMDG